MQYELVSFLKYLRTDAATPRCRDAAILKHALS